MKTYPPYHTKKLITRVTINKEYHPDSDNQNHHHTKLKINKEK